ncbi:Gibberellin-regulated protein 10 [Capsicum chinense]|nr:Gibberellin-regulated protein 10 [Capsicum chinense]
MKWVLVTFMLVFALVLTSSFLQPATAKPVYCAQKCKGRCSKAGLMDRCIKYCELCCAKCKCVPSGTYGNKHQCPCYRDLKNSKGKTKCP